MEIRTRKGKDSKIPLLSILIVSLVALSIGYSALSSTLKINGVASVSSMSWRVEFQNLGEAVLTGNAQKISDPVISTDKTELKSYNVNFLDPGDSITYTFQIANNGTIDAKLSEIVKENISCEGYGSDEQAAKDATNVCANLEYSLKYNEEEEHFDNAGSTTNFSNNTEVNDLLRAGEVKDMVLTLKYKSPIDGATIEEPKDDVSISGLGITLTYSQIKTPTVAEKNPSTPLPSVSFAEDSWDTIIKNVKSGNTSSYHVGDTKEISLKNYGTHTVRIANMSTPDECKQEVFSQSACGFVVEFADIITKHYMNPSGDYNGTNYANGWNMGGWPESAMYKFVNDESDENSIINSLPTILRESIGNTYTLSGHGVNDGYNFESNDKLYFLSSSEVWAKGTSSTITTDSSADYTRQLDYYKNMGVTTNSNLSSAIKSFEGTDTWWWLRTASSNYHSAFFTVNATGGHIGNNASLNMGVSPAFRILEDKKEESSADPEISQFASDSWKTIADNVKNDNTSNYHVGDTKTMKIDNSDYTFRIVNMSTPDICNTKNFSQSACGFVVEMSNSEAVLAMNETDTVEGGWGKSYLRNILDYVIYYSFSFSLYVDQTDIFSYKNRSTNEYYTLSDYYYIPSTIELYSTDVENTNEEFWNQFDDYGLTRQLDYYAEAKKNGTLDTELRKTFNNTANAAYWTRSIVNNQSFNYVGNATTTVDSTSELGISVLFKLPGPNKSNTKPEGSSFEKDSWETIATNIKNGNTSNYHVGDTKKVTLKTLGTKTLKIVNMSSPYVCNDENYSQTACGFVVEFDDIVINKQAFSATAVSDEWSNTKIREYLNDEFLGEVPEDLLNVVSNTKTVSYGLDSSKTLYKSNDKFYIKGVGEIQHIPYLMAKEEGFSEDNRITRVLDYYRPTRFYPTDITKMVKKYNGTNNAKYWYRTTIFDDKKNKMYYFDKSFNTTADGSIEAGVVPAFRITGNTGSDSGNESGTFAGDSWETIAKNVKNKTTSNYHVGDTKTINFGDSGGATFRIVNMSTPDICKTENFSQSACGFVVEFVNLFTKEKMNNTDTVEGGWPETYLRMLLNEALLIEYKNVLPSALVNAINNTKIVSYQNRDANSYYITSDKFYIPSTIELYSTDVTGMSEETWKQYDDYGLTRQLDYYAEAKNNGTLDDALKKTYSSIETPYWTRSIINNSQFSTVGDVPSGSNNTSTLGVNLLFRLKGSKEDDPVGSGTFYDDSWETIANNIKTGNTGNYHIGDTKEVTLKTLGQKTLKIVNMSTPDECNNTNYSQSACGFVVEFDDIVTNKSLSDTTAVSNKWSNTKVSEYLNNEFLNEVPEDLLNVVAPTKIVSYIDSHSKIYTTSVDKFYIKGYSEIVDLDPSGISETFSITDDLTVTHALDYYRSIVDANDLSVYFKKSFNGVDGVNYWTRTFGHSDTEYAYFTVGSDSLSEITDCTTELGVVPMFRIAAEDEVPSVSFSEDSWNIIAANVRNGNTSNYKVGDTKTQSNLTFRIANMSTPSECKQENFSQSACGFVVEIMNILSTNGMNETNTAEGAWANSDFRTTINSGLPSELPADLVNVVANTNIYSYKDRTTNEYYSSTDKYYIPSVIELYSTDGTGMTEEIWNQFDDYGLTRQLDYYVEAKKNGTLNDAITKYTSSGTEVSYWTRSVYNNTAFYNIGSSGTSDNSKELYAIGLFRLEGPSD